MEVRVLRPSRPAPEVPAAPARGACSEIGEPADETVAASAAPVSVPLDAGTACVVTCHNYGRYLRECLDSVLAQTRPFASVVVVDDASDDDTAAICAGYAQRGVRYLRTEFRDVARARNAGYELLPRQPFALFVDADNWLPAGYHEGLMGAMAPGVGAVYCPLRYVGEHEGTLSPSIRPFDYWALRERNFADACALVRREAFEQAGCWAPGMNSTGGLQDWALWLRMTRYGWDLRFTDATELRYRLHPDRMSVKRQGVYECGVEVMRDSMLTCVVTLFAGRTWALPHYARWLKALEWRRENLHVVAVDNSGSARFGAALQAMLSASGIGYTRVPDGSRVVETATADEVARSAELRIRHNFAMNVHLARLYARAREHVPARADLVWSVEDDVDPGPRALFDLALVLFREKRCGMVAGCLRSRFQRGRLIAWESLDGEPHDRGYVTEAPEPGAVKRLVATGFFCSLFRRPVFDGIRFRPGLTGMMHPYYDWAACADVRAMGREILMAGAVRCGHWQEDGTCLVP